MKNHFTVLMAGLLLAVGWTMKASAQALPEGGFAERLGLIDDATTLKCVTGVDALDMMSLPVATAAKPGVTTRLKAPMRVPDSGPNSVVKKKAYYQQFTYSYTDDQGVLHENVDPTEEAKDPHQIYELLRWVYGNPNFPGPTYSAYTPGNVQEDPVVYGPIEGGWNLTSASDNTSQVLDNNITISLDDTYAFITSIVVSTGDNEITSWVCNTAGYNLLGYTEDNVAVYASDLPSDWTSSNPVQLYSDGENIYYIGYIYDGGTITVPVPGSYTDFQVVIHAIGASTEQNSSITVNGETKELTDSWADYTWNVTFQPQEVPDFVQGTVQAPFEDGYTALIVSLYNDTTKIYPEPDAYDGSWEFTNTSDLIDYIRDNIQSVKLLTDGLRIGSRDDYSIGTVFNCDGTYNRFFLLGKGQARKKSPQLLANIANGYWPSYCGEEGPFKTMFEEFSPTTGAKGSDIKDFYSKLNEGYTYNVVHDCASVIQNKHQFSMSGRTGTQAIALTGLNFFIPDYRLKHWTTTDSYGNGYTVDGRDMVAYMRTNADGEHVRQFVYGTNIYEFAAWFGQYNQDYAPKMGLYKINLDAVAEAVAESHEPDNENYKVTLTWVSSLDEMSNPKHNVPQVFTVFYYDENNQRQYLVVEGYTNTDGETGMTTLVYYVPQKERSYTIDYVVTGSPDDNDHPQFVAESNIAGVIIPGWKDFVGLALDHHESDFVVADMANWYRNFLVVQNEDIYNGLTVSKVSDGMNSFNLYRTEYKGDVAGPTTKVATLKFDNPTSSQVHYKVTYMDQEILDPKYERSAMNVPDEGYIRVKGNGDLVIWPNGYNVNFKSITIKNGNTTLSSWTSDQSSLPAAWKLSPGSDWVNHTIQNTNDKVGYIEGGGYIYIPDMLNNYSNLTVTISAYGEGGTVSRIAVNDDPKTIANNSAATYSWSSLSGDAKAPRRANRATNTLVNNTFDDANWWTVIDANGDDYTWSISNGRASYRYYSYGAADDWLVTSPIALEAGKTYRFYIDTWCYFDSYPEKLEVKMASANDETALSSGTAVIGSTTVDWEDAVTLSNENVTVSTSGNYYFGIHAISDRDQYYLYVDNLKIEYENTDPTIEASTNDVTLACAPGESTDQTVTVTGENLTGNITATLSDPDGVFSLNTANLGTTGGDLTITYSPTAAGTNTATIVLTSDGANTVTINVTGNCIPGTTYQLVTDPATQLVDGKKYILVYDNYAMGALSGTSGYGTRVDIVNNGDGTVTVPGNADAMVLTLHNYSSYYTTGYTFTINGGANDGKYLMPAASASSNTNLTTNNTAVDNAVWHAVADTKPTGGYGLLSYRSTDTRGLIYQVSGTRFSHYAKSNVTANGTGYYYGLLYVEQEGPVHVDGGLLRLHLLMADQFKEPIPADNSHPDYYEYVLKYEPAGEDPEQSGTVDVEVLKTTAKVNGYYTLDEINNDVSTTTKAELLEMDVLTSDITMTLPNENPDILYFQMQGKKNGNPVLNQDYLSKLQYMKNVRKYEEVYDQSPIVGKQYNPQETYHSYDVRTPITTGNYGNYMTYAPSVSSWGIGRRYFEDDGENNTYGAPIWKNSVGKAEMKAATLEKQVGSDGSALSSVSWTDGNGQPCCLYILDKITAYGYLPSSEVANIEYEPYMFRVFVESPTGKLRGFIPPVPGTTTNPGTNTQNNPEFTNTKGPWSVYEENVEDAQVVNLEGGKGVIWQKSKNDADWENNAVFGALSNMIQGTQSSATFNPEDLIVYVRFYYKVKDSNAKSRDGEARPGNGSQSPGFEPSPWTAVEEVKYVGDVVSVTYVNTLGMTSDRPFEGVNVVITRFSDGTTRTEKVVR